MEEKALRTNGILFNRKEKANHIEGEKEQTYSSQLILQWFFFTKQKLHTIEDWEFAPYLACNMHNKGNAIFLQKSMANAEQNRASSMQSVEYISTRTWLVMGLDYEPKLAAGTW